jgi:glutamine amidotransferase
MHRTQVTVIDYGVGNLLSVKRSLENQGAEVCVTSDPKIIRSSQKLVLPGVGAFPRAIQALRELKLVEAIQEYAGKQRPLLAICLGMQLLLEVGEEFIETSGLSLVPGRVVELPRRTLQGEILRIPHIGWNRLLPQRDPNDWQDTILGNVEVGAAVYFVHSFMVQPVNQTNILAHALYGGYKVPAVISSNFITGCQFHPEKSGLVGLKIIRNFISQ